MQEKWDKRFTDMAQLVSTWSKDPSTQCGAVITRGKHIVSVGFNGFPAGCLDNEKLYADRETKYSRIIHAEVNAILSAKQDLTGCTIYVYPLLPCDRCAAQIIQAGITTVVSLEASDEMKARWGTALNAGKDLFTEAGIEWKTYFNRSL